MDYKTEKTSFISEASAKKFLQRVQDTVDTVIKSDDFGNQDLETVQGILEDVETLISESYAKSKGCAKEYLTAEIMLIALKARILRSCEKSDDEKCEKSDNVKCENSSEESLNVELSEPFLKSDNVKSENSNKENLNDEAPLVQSKGKTGEVKDSAGAIKGLLPPSLEQLKLIDCVNGVQSLPPPGEQEMVRPQVGPIETRGVLGGGPHIYPLSSWGPLDALLSQLDYSLWCCVNFEITGVWPFNDRF